MERINSTLYSSLFKTAKTYPSKEILRDLTNSFTYRQLILATIILEDKLAVLLKEKNVGFFLPNIASAVVCFFALQRMEKVVAMLNFTAGISNNLRSCRVAEIKSIITARQFITQAKLDHYISSFQDLGIKVIYLEDLAAQINLWDKLKSLQKYWFYKPQAKTIDPAVILFTSGSEGAPKAVVLSHQNLVTNIWQISQSINFTKKDSMFNLLPIFHSFGMTAGILLPLLSGMKAFLYPSPLNYKQIPKAIKASGATLFFSTDSFLNNYAKFAEKDDFANLRCIFAGAEKLRKQTYDLYCDRFNIEITQGYGVTESSPVIAVNTKQFSKVNSVGKFLPEIEYRLEDSECSKVGGRLFVKGPNVMLGYLNENGSMEAPCEGYHDTGDIVEIDQQGFLYIVGRAKRFAKIAGEMVSLAYVESCISDRWPDYVHAVVAVDSLSKGETLLLYTNYQDASISEIVEYFSKHDIPMIFAPKKLKIIEQLPVLGSGKIDYNMLEKFTD